MIGFFLPLLALCLGLGLVSISHLKFIREVEVRFSKLEDKNRYQPKDPQPICGCGHHLAFHKEGEGCKKPNHSWVQRDGQAAVLPPAKPKPELGLPKYVSHKDSIHQVFLMMEYEQEMKAWQQQEEQRKQLMREWSPVTTPCPCQGYIGPEYYPVVLP